MPTLRAATLADIDAMWALRTRAILRCCAADYPSEVIVPWSAAPVPRSYPALVESGGALVAQDGDDDEDGAMLGYAILEMATGEVDAVFVDPQAGGRGIGKILLAALERMALGHGHTRVYLSASLNAVPFYRAAGYVSLGSDVYAHPCGVALDCVKMEKRLPAMR